MHLRIADLLKNSPQACALAIATAVTSVALTGCNEPRREQPNIVLILADDLGIGDISAYNHASKIRTPHIDALAANGALFDDASTPASVCTPTRYAILTGRYAWRTRLKSGVLWAWDPPLLDPDTITLPEIFKDAGYTTAMFGKWHLGWIWPTTDAHPPIGQGMTTPPGTSGKNVDFSRPLRGGPTDNGFDYYFGVDVPNFPPYAWIENDQLTDAPRLKKPTGMYGANGPMTEGWSFEALTPTITDRIVRFIEEQKSQTKPFFLYYAMTSPHTPIAPTREWQGTSGAGSYGDFVQQLDSEIGKIASALDRSGLKSNTLLIFLADNGSAGLADNGSQSQTALKTLFHHDTNLNLKGYKLSIFEGGFRIPMIAMWPGRINKGSRIDTPFTAIDLMRTLARIADIELKSGAAPDSYDMTPAWIGLTSKGPMREHAIYQSFNGSIAMREQNYKLVAGSGDGTGKDKDASADAYYLYNLSADPQERNDLSKTDPTRLERMKQQLLKYNHQITD